MIHTVKYTSVEAYSAYFLGHTDRGHTWSDIYTERPLHKATDNMEQPTHKATYILDGTYTQRGHTHGRAIHMETYIQRSHTHGGDIQTEGAYT